MSFLRDGRMVMTTHTTAPAKTHPAWLPDSYYTHQWEGFPGSQVLIYDPATREAHSLGTPVPRESIYGAALDVTTDSLYFLGYLRGHAYRFDLQRRSVTDLGQATEFGSFRLAHGPDGHLYSATRSGHLYRLNVTRQCIENLNIVVPPSDHPLSRRHRQLHYSSIAPDGRMIMSFIYSDELFAYDVKTNRLESLGRFDPQPEVACIQPRSVFGMQMDVDGCLWYCVSTQAGEWLGLVMHLVRWDVLRGETPQLLGVLGTPERACATAAEAILDGDFLHIADSNHGDDPPGVLTLHLPTLKRSDGPSAIATRDAHAYLFVDGASEIFPGERFEEVIQPYHDMYVRYQSDAIFTAEYADVAINAIDVSVVCLWHHIVPEESAIRELSWDSDGVLRGTCGRTSFFEFVISDNQLASVTPVSRSIPMFKPDTLPPHVASLQLPHRQGRRFLATPSCWAPWSDDRLIVGTTDGLVARVHRAHDDVFSYGAVAPHGPVHQMVSNQPGTIAFGVAGDDNDLGHCFVIDNVHGVRELGRTRFSGDAQPGIANSCQPRCLALSPDGDSLAIGVHDRLGCVYLYRGLGRTR